MAVEGHKLAILRGLLKFKSNQQKIWAVLIFLSIVIALISYDILFGTYSINSNKKISNVVVSKEKELTKINIENTELIEKIDSIKNDESYVENMAREEFGLIKEGEEYFEIEPE